MGDDEAKYASSMHFRFIIIATMVDIGWSV